MARIRTIKPEFWKDEELSTLSPEANLLAVGLLNIADDEGYFRCHEKLIESEIFPLRELSVSVHGQLSELSRIRYIRLFLGNDGKKYGKVRTFTENQIVNRPKASKIKDLDLTEIDSLNDHGVITDESLGKGREGKGKECQVVELKHDPVQIIFSHWQEKLKHPKAVLDPKRKRHIQTALKNYPVDDLKKAIDGISVTAHNIGENENKQRYDDIHIVFKDSANIERFMQNANSSGNYARGLR